MVRLVCKVGNRLRRMFNLKSFVFTLVVMCIFFLTPLGKKIGHYNLTRMEKLYTYFFKLDPHFQQSNNDTNIDVDKLVTCVTKDGDISLSAKSEAVRAVREASGNKDVYTVEEIVRLYLENDSDYAKRACAKYGDEILIN